MVGYLCLEEEIKYIIQGEYKYCQQRHNCVIWLPNSIKESFALDEENKITYGGREMKERWKK